MKSELINEELLILELITHLTVDYDISTAEITHFMCIKWMHILNINLFKLLYFLSCFSFFSPSIIITRQTIIEHHKMLSP